MWYLNVETVIIEFNKIEYTRNNRNLFIYSLFIIFIQKAKENTFQGANNTAGMIDLKF